METKSSPWNPLTARQEERGKVGPLKTSNSRKKVIHEQCGFVSVVEMWDEQKWVQQIEIGASRSGC